LVLWFFFFFFFFLASLFVYYFFRKGLITDSEREIIIKYVIVGKRKLQHCHAPAESL